MLIVSDEFFEACKDNEREVFTRVIINDKVTYLKDKIKKVDYSMGAFGGESFQIGSTQSATIKIVFSEVIEGLKELDEIKVEVGFKIKGTGLPSNINNVSRVDRAKIGRSRLVTYVADRYEFVPLGTFYISDRVDPDRNENTTTVEARDSFIFMEAIYESDLKYPAKMADIALEIANKSGSVIDSIAFNHLSNYTLSKPVGYTYRQAIGLIGQLEGGFVCFDREGRLSIRTLADPNFKIEPNEYFLKGLTKSELLYQPKGVSCRVVNQLDESSSETKIIQAGSTNGAQIVLENNIMTQDLLDSVFQKVRYINFYSISLNWRGNPALEVGDWVTMTDRSGKKFKSPVLNYSMTFDGGFTSTISADTKAYSAEVSTFKGPLQQKLDDIDYRIDAAGKNNVYEGTEEPKNPKEGDIWFKKNGPDDEIWVYKQTSPGVFEWVMTTSTALEEDIKDQIENSTPKDEIIKTINLSNEMEGKEWLKITGAKLWLTDETKIDNAIITSAMIASIDAGTINTGTLNAAKVNIVNLNASSISTGVLTGVEIKGVKITGSNVSSAGTNYKIQLVDGSLQWIRTADDKKVFEIHSKIDSGNYGIMYFSVEYGGTFTLHNNHLDRTFLQVASYSMELYCDLDRLRIQNTTWGTKNRFKLTADKEALRYSGENTVTKELTLSDGYFNVSTGTGPNFSMNSNMRLYSNTNIEAYPGNGGFRIQGSLSVSGSKNSLVTTESYGERLLNAYETPEYYFADYGKEKTNEYGEVQIELEPIFLETINSESENYHVFVSSYSKGIVWVDKIFKDRFIVKSEPPNVEFSYNVVAYRKEYENVRLAEPVPIDNDIEERKNNE